MANYCFFAMKIVGSKEKVEKAFSYFDNPKDSEYYVPGIYNLYTTKKIELNNKVVAYEFTGSCRWSIVSSMGRTIDEKSEPQGINLKSLSEMLNLNIEAYSKESGLGFQEHFLYKNGQEIIAECIDWQEEYEDEDAGEYIPSKGGYEKWEFEIYEKWKEKIL